MTEAVRSHRNGVHSVATHTGYQLSRGLLLAVRDESVDSQRRAFAILDIVDATGTPNEAVAYVSRFGHMDLILDLEGSEVDLLATPAGIEVLPPFYAPDHDEIMWPPESAIAARPNRKHGRPSAAGSPGQSALLRTLVGEVGRVAARHRMVTAAWVHMP